MSAKPAAPALVVYTYASCDTCRRATRWLTQRGLTFVERPIRETPPTTAELARALRALDGDRGRLFNRSGRDYREQKLAEQLPGWSEAETLRRLAANGNLVKRPLLLGADVVLVGFDEAAWAAALG
ncbi:MAG TPA: Spx/MgsR family RNA polymerase-binding regulatory protein [Opitutaceae bacterium]|jgi:arsenate reductase|nr:Spx/MgsR family RNA polymerase-binding regulatory protein [Opitutaceae bacterium]